MSKAITSKVSNKSCPHFMPALTEEEKQAHVHAYLNSSQSRQSYCDAHGLRLSSLKCWITKYRKPSVSQFIPVQSAESSFENMSSSRIEIYKNTCKILLINFSNVRLLQDILKEVL